MTTSQQRGLESLTEFYSFHRQNKCVAGISTQPRPLLVGPSGSGKTALIRHFAEKNHLPLLDINSGTWIVSGAASGRTTLRLIRKFLSRENEGILYIDELDKFTATTDWMRSVEQECMALIDRRTASFEDWSQEEQLRLEKFFIVGAAPGRTSITRNSQVLGFDLADEVILSDKLTNQKQIPDEILFRFPHVIELKRLSAAHFKQQIGQIRAELKLPVLSKERLASLAYEAVKSRRQNRWLEQYVVQALRERLFPQ